MTPIAEERCGKQKLVSPAVWWNRKVGFEDKTAEPDRMAGSCGSLREASNTDQGHQDALATQMKIAMVHPSFELRGGAENVILWMSDAFRDRGHSITIFTKELDPQTLPNPSLKKHLFRLLPLNPFRFLFESKRLDAYIYLPYFMTKLKGFDLVICHNFPSYYWIAEYIHCTRERPFCLWFCHEPVRRLYPQSTEKSSLAYTLPNASSWHNEQIMEYQEHCQRALKFRRYDKRRRRDYKSVTALDAVFSNSFYTASLVKEIFGLEAIPCPLGIPLQNFPSRPSTVNTEHRQFLCIGSPHPLKNLLTVFEAFLILCKSLNCNTFELVITGEGLEHSFFSIKRYEAILDRVRFIGRVSDGQLSNLYRSALATIYIPLDEPFGLVPIESMLHGTPVIASNHAGPSETVIDGGTGFLVDPLVPAHVAKAMSLLIHDKALRSTMSEQGMKHVIAYYTFEHFMERFNSALYERFSVRI